MDGKRRDAFDALGFSAEIRRGERMHLFGLAVEIALLNMLGLILFVVGVLVLLVPLQGRGC